MSKKISNPPPMGKKPPPPPMPPAIAKEIDMTHRVSPFKFSRAECEELTRTFIKDGIIVLGPEETIDDIVDKTESLWIKTRR